MPLIIVGIALASIVWIVGLIHMVAHFENDAIRTMQAAIPLLIVVAIASWRNAGIVMGGAAVGFVFGLPLLWGIGLALTQQRWMLLPAAFSILCLATGFGMLA
jgi:hypothetical protein